MDDYMIVKCPHCEDEIMIMKKDINCRIFRHGVFIKTMQPIPPHSSYETCQFLKENGIIYGCGKPFELNERDEAVICDYK